MASSPQMVQPMPAPHSSQLLRNFAALPPSCLPIGLDALYAHLLRLYPTQRNPIQLSTSQKCWLGGADPLDYVNVYFNAGDRSQRIPPHWHYVSMGLTDLHGDGRVHRFKGHNQPSGLGFELTFRLKREATDGPRPPVWPAAMMQHLAKYAFRTAKLSVGDFVKWDVPLDGVNESRIQHLLLVSEPQLPNLSAACGTVEFIQIVGICEEERKAVQKWNVFGVSELLRKYPAAGGCWLITDLRRGESVFDVDPCAKDIVDLGVAAEGSNLSGIQAWCWWSEWTDFAEETNPTAGAAPVVTSSCRSGHSFAANSGDAQCSAQGGFDYGGVNDSNYGDQSSQHDVSNYYTRITSYMEHIYNTPAPTTVPTAGTDNVFPIAAVHLRLNAEAATFLPLALKGRLAHGRHFTFKAYQNGYGDITLLPPGVAGSFSSYDEPYACRGTWLHAQVCPELQELMLADLSFFESITNSVSAIQKPKTFQWPLYKLKITVLPDVPAF